MRLLHLCFDDMVPVFGCVLNIGGVAWHRSNTFSAEDGWELFALGEGRFSLQHKSMAAPAYVGGYGYSYVEASEPVVDGAPEGSHGEAPPAESESSAAASEPSTKTRRKR